MKGKNRRAAVPRSAGREQKKGTPTGVPFTHGAGYGNRTRLCGLGSDHSTDELTLRGKGIIADCPGNFNTQFAELFRQLPHSYFPTGAMIDAFCVDKPTGKRRIHCAGSSGIGLDCRKKGGLLKKPPNIIAAVIDTLGPHGYRTCVFGCTGQITEGYDLPQKEEDQDFRQRHPADAV